MKPLTDQFDPTPLQETPLSAEETSLADRIANRLHEELRALLRKLPDHVRGGSAVSRYLELNRATCQRIVAAATEARPDPHLLTRVPGVQGMRQFLAAMQCRGLGEDTLASADAAVEQFEDLLDRLGGSQSKLAARLEIPPAQLPGLGTPDPGSEGLEHHRATLFESARALCGRASDLSLVLYAYRPVPGDRTRIESFTVSGYVGHRARSSAVPLIMLAGSMPMQGARDEERAAAGFSSLDDSPAVGKTPQAMLEGFCTSPLPMVTSQGPNGLLLQTVDPKESKAGEKIDLVFGHRPALGSPHPATEDPPVQESWSLQHYPARHLILDVWLHRDLARSCIPGLDLHLYPADLPAFASHRWISRFPHGPRLEILGTGPRDAATPYYSRYPELLETAFSLVDWPLEEFIGHRCDVAYPLWRGGYCISCDFSEEKGDA